MSKIGKREGEVLKVVIDKGEITTKEANDLLKRHYYCNHEHYVAEILSRLVKRNALARKERGVYVLPFIPKEHEDPDQLNLFS